MTSRAGRGYHADRVIIDEVISDDTMIDALSKARLGDDTEETFRLLAAWRREVHTDSVRVLVDTETAAAAIRAARPRARRPDPLKVAVLAAAVLAILGSAVGLASQPARRDDPPRSQLRMARRVLRRCPVSDDPAYLPSGIADALRVGFRDLDGDNQWKIARLAERAFAQGYQHGYVRGFDDGYRHGAAEAKADGDDQ